MEIIVSPSKESRESDDSEDSFLHIPKTQNETEKLTVTEKMDLFFDEFKKLKEEHLKLKSQMKK